jgi:hypothetical protein
LALLASFWKSCFAETIDKDLGLPMTGVGYIFRYSEMGAARARDIRRQNSCQLPLHVLIAQDAPPGLGEIELLI